jgi:hypothetical protein
MRYNQFKSDKPVVSYRVSSDHAAEPAAVAPTTPGLRIKDANDSALLLMGFGCAAVDSVLEVA